ncbi:receptor-like protein 9DC3 [Hevea brasiliensis]|uniref:receptor-like protein 9DC3 n=1 Tax=Hevea brasiliensis TaxID=3981 RepID=UPI0025D309F9|nr:receptor-like protein 9DC3 [Hevea brasiliensis]
MSSSVSLLCFCIPAVLLLVYSTSSVASTNGENETDRVALLGFKAKITHDPLGIMASWNRSVHFCGWYGVTCGRRHQRVTELNLSSLNLVGSISPHIGNLSFLRHLNLANNIFGGEIPMEICGLRRLERLILRNMSITGKIPLPLANLSSLEVLDLGDNSLQGPLQGVPPSIKFFSIAGNNISGQVLSFICGSNNLIFLDLSENNFSGKIPKCFGNFSSDLLVLNLGMNQFHGPLQVPPCSTEYFYIADNNISGEIPSSICNLNYLKDLDLSNNSLTGMLPKCLANFSNLRFLDLAMNRLHGPLQVPPSSTLFFSLAYNNFSGEIPSSICNLNYLQFLHLSYNSLSGMLPKCIGNFSNLLLYLDLAANQFHGPLQVPPSSTTFLSFADNNFSGEIPSSICRLNSLQYLYLFKNNISGTIPKCFGNFRNLSVLDLGNNNLHGSIPATCVEGNSLSRLDLNGNQLEGPLPRSLINCSNLEILNLGNNRINGSFPYWLENLEELRVLVLRRNRFSGPIPTPKARFPFPGLLVIDLSHNDFTGPLPTRYFQQFQAMMKEKTGEYYVVHVTITIKGVDFDVIKVLDIFAMIDLSYNQFRGEISESIGGLLHLTGLNFSHNHLTGHIPQAMGNLSNLEWLDLSSNKLVGSIPEQLVDLTFLEVLNLSFNELTGRIPQGKQFNTFGIESYKGNLGLCGFPLSKARGNDIIPALPLSEGDLSADVIFEWNIVLMGYASGLVIGVAIGYIMFQTGKPQWFVTNGGR